MAAIWWEDVSGPGLAQGDYLPGCIVPIMPATFTAHEATDESVVSEFVADEFDLIVLTQSCDLEQGKHRT